VLGVTQTPSVARAQVARPTLDEEIADEEEYVAPRREPALPKVAVAAGVDEDEDDALSYFARLAEED
jgi:hypothetical protein